MSREKTKSYSDRRIVPRYHVLLDVNYRHGEVYLFSRSSNLSELGIFLLAPEPLPTGSEMELKFTLPDGGDPITLAGEVVWVESGEETQNPGMGIRFKNPTEDVRRRVRSLVKTMAYLE